MANTILTPTAVTREALRILHQKLNFVGSITREYDDSFAKDGAKIGDSLKIRLPNQYTVRSGANLSTQDTTESSTTLQVATQKGVDTTFSSSELTLSLDDFSSRILEPAMTVLAANIEYDAMSMYKDVYQSVWNGGSALTLAKVLAGKKVLQDALVPLNDRTASLQTQETVDLVDGLKGLFQDSAAVAKQYREGYMGRTAGFDFVENTLWPAHTRGGSNSAYVVNGAGQSGAALVVGTGATAPSQGDVITIAGVFKVHPETKVSTGILQQFVIGAGATTTSFPISPAIVATGATQNVSNVPANAAAIAFLGTASTAVSTSMLYQKGAFAFATADLQMPKGVDFSAREVLDGISMRIVRQYAIATDTFPCRIDVLYGYKTIRAQLAARLHNN
jgi:aspartate 1-decarboxylase